MGSFSILKSKTFWGAVLGAAGHVYFSDAGNRPQAIVEGVGAVIAAWGVRGAIAKNGENR